MKTEIQKQQEFEQFIEELIDKHSVSRILNAMANICHEKAQHIRESYQDEPLAKDWDKNGDKLAKIIIPKPA